MVRIFLHHWHIDNNNDDEDDCIYSDVDSDNSSSAMLHKAETDVDKTDITDDDWGSRDND